MKTYKGKYKPKNKEKYKGDPENIIYRSMWERYCFKWCDECSDVIEWSSEEVVVPYFYEVDKKYHRYFMDLKIKYKSGKVALVEIKPDKQTRPPEYKGRKTKRYISESLEYIKNVNKWEAAEEYAKDKGWDFQVWTEETLESMGIKPKPLKPLKKMRRI